MRVRTCDLLLGWLVSEFVYRLRISFLMVCVLDVAWGCFAFFYDKFQGHRYMRCAIYGLSIFFLQIGLVS